MQTAKGTLIVKYPPTFDGELHIHYTREFQDLVGFKDTFSFTITGEGTVENKLLQAIKDMQRQFE